MIHTSTVVSRTPQGILSYLARLPQAHTSRTLLFTLSSNAPRLGDLVSALTTFSPSSVGCLSAPLPGADNAHIACALAFFEPDAATPFRSVLPGRAAPQVGRWHAFRKRGEESAGLADDVGFDENVDWEDVWSRSAGDAPLPAELAHLPPNDVHTILYLSDSAPEGLSAALRAFPRATKLGLLASSTPFVTGRPTTLLRGAAVHSTGAVGLALRGPRAPVSAVRFPGLVPITPRLSVTGSEGNLVQELDGTNPSRLLLQAIQRAVEPGTAKEDEFFLGALEPASGEVYHITSGDPSRGTMALESGAAPMVGSTVQLFHRPKSATLSALPSVAATPEHGSTFTFVTSPSDVHPDAVGTPLDGDDDVTVFDNAFVAASENGFLLSRGEEAAWTCKVVGAEARLSYGALA